MLPSRFVLLFSFFAALVGQPVFALAETAVVSCECEVKSCGPCEIETDSTYFSEKCGEGNARVKSCKKATCAAVDNQKACFALFKKEAAAKLASAREPASVVAGEVLSLEGEVLLSRGRVVAPLKNSLIILEDDMIETAAGAKVLVRLKDGSEVILASLSQLRFARVKVNEARSFRDVKLELIHGGVRTRVQKKYAGESAFEVRTKTAIAHVRGTDFLTTFERGAKEWITEVRTLEGLVRLESLGTGSKSQDVAAGTFTSLVIKAPEQIDLEEEFLKSIEKSFFAPSMKLQDDDVTALKKATEFRPRAPASELPASPHPTKKAGIVKAAKGAKTPHAAATIGGAAKVASAGASGGTSGSASGSICESPAGDYNKCSYTCEGEKGCGACVRRLCRANGAWADPRRLPASQHDLCVPGQPTVRDCGSYF